MLDLVAKVYDDSDRDAARALYERLRGIGPIGSIAENLFRAQKTRARAKSLSWPELYDRKQWLLGNLAPLLSEHAESCGLRWGWGIDAQQPFHKFVLYVDLPTGQVSFHAEARGSGPDYPGEWDGVPGRSAERIVRWVARVLEGFTA